MHWAGMKIICILVPSSATNHCVTLKLPNLSEFRLGKKMRAWFLKSLAVPIFRDSIIPQYSIEPGHFPKFPSESSTQYYTAK